MLTLLAIVVGAVIVWSLRVRLNQLEETTREFGSRLDALERTGSAEAVALRKSREHADRAQAGDAGIVRRIVVGSTAAEHPVRGEEPRPAPVAPEAARPAPFVPSQWGSAGVQPPEPGHTVAAEPEAGESAPAVAPVSVAAAADAESLEARIGSRWLLYVGVCSIVIGIAYFEKLAIDRRWIGDFARVVQGAIAGVLLIAAGLRFVRRGLRLYGQVLSGAGLAILYVSIYASFNFYRLIDQPSAFAMMSGVTLIAAAIADQQQSRALALFAVGGGFATPFLLPAGSPAPSPLFGYDAVLIAGTLFIARRRRWPELNAVSYGFTALTVATWAAAFYTPAWYLTTELFLTLFCAMFLFVLYDSRSRPSAPPVRAVLTTAPVAYYLASLAILGSHPHALLTYLVLLALIGALVGSKTTAGVRCAFWAAAALPLLLWSGSADGQDSRTIGLTAWAAIYALNLAGLFEATLKDDGSFGDLDVVHLHLNGLGAYAGVYLLVEPASSGAAASIAGALALLNVVAAVGVGVEKRGEALHFIGLAFTLLTIAIGLELEGAWLTAAWAAEGAAIMALALGERREWLRFGGAALFLIAVARLLDLQASEPAATQAVVLNQRGLCGLFVTALAYALAAWHRRAGKHLRNLTTNVTILIVGASVLTLTWLTSEINAYWRIQELRGLSAIAAPASRFAREMMISVTWAVYATVLIVVGLKRRYAPIRYLAMALFAVTTAKVFAIDLAELDQIYRILSIVGLGVALLLTSYLYQRFRVSES